MGLAQTLPSVDEGEVTSAVIRLTEDDPALLALGIRLIDVVDPQGTPEASLFVARAVATPGVGDHERRRGLRQLTSWANTWAQAETASPDDVEADSDAQTVIERITSAAHRMPPATLPLTAELAHAAAQYAPAWQTDALARELIATLEAARNEGEATDVLRAVEPLGQLVRHGPAETARQLGDALLGPLDEAGDRGRPVVRSAWASIDGVRCRAAA